MAILPTHTRSSTHGQDQNRSFLFLCGQRRTYVGIHCAVGRCWHLKETPCPEASQSSTVVRGSDFREPKKSACPNEPLHYQIPRTLCSPAWRNAKHAAGAYKPTHVRRLVFVHIITLPYLSGSRSLFSATWEQTWPKRLPRNSISMHSRI